MNRRLTYLILIIFLTSFSISGQSGNKDYQYALIEGVKQKNIGNIPGAIELYKMVVEANDSVSVAHYELGTLYALMGQDKNAKYHLAKAHAQDQDNKWYFESYLDFLMNGKDLKLAEKLLKKALKEDSENVDYLFRLANVHFFDGKSRKAIKTLNKIEKNRGFSDRLTLMKANIYEQGLKYDKALSEVEKVIEAFPESIEFNVVAAELALKSKDKALAAEYYMAVFELDSMNIFALTNLTDYYRQNNDYQRSFYYLNKSFESEEIKFDKKMAILSYYLSDESFFNSYPALLETLVQTLLNMYPDKREIHLLGSDFYIQSLRYNEALDALLPILTMKERKYELWKQGLLLANATARVRDMKMLANDAFEIYPDSAELIYFKGVAEFELNEYDSVLISFSNANLLKIVDADMKSQIRIILAETHHKLENYSSSDSLFREIIRDEADNYMVMNNFSYYLALREESLEEAREYSFKTIVNNPENGTYLDTYAWILYKLKLFEEADQTIRKALKFGGDNDPDVNEHAAEISRALGSFALARSFYQKAIILGGDKEKLILKLEEIQDQNEL